MPSANCYDTRLLDERQGRRAMFNKTLIFPGSGPDPSGTPKMLSKIMLGRAPREASPKGQTRLPEEWEPPLQSLGKYLRIWRVNRRWRGGQCGGRLGNRR